MHPQRCPAGLKNNIAHSKDDILDELRDDGGASLRKLRLSFRLFSLFRRHRQRRRRRRRRH